MSCTHEQKYDCYCVLHVGLHADSMVYACVFSSIHAHRRARLHTHTHTLSRIVQIVSRLGAAKPNTIIHVCLHMRTYLYMRVHTYRHTYTYIHITQQIQRSLEYVEQATESLVRNIPAFHKFKNAVCSIYVARVYMLSSRAQRLPRHAGHSKDCLCRRRPCHCRKLLTRVRLRLASVPFGSRLSCAIFSLCLWEASLLL
jgi:hypothetical protein